MIDDHGNVIFRATPYAATVRILDRAKDFGFSHRARMAMDLAAVHAAIPLDLDALAEADDADFLHDIAGISFYIDRTTGTLAQCFVPRCAARAAAAT